MSKTRLNPSLILEICKHVNTYGHIRMTLSHKYLTRSNEVFDNGVLWMEGLADQSVHVHGFMGV